MPDTQAVIRQKHLSKDRCENVMLDAIQQGILTSSTKDRLEELEKQKTELSVQIIKEEMEQPLLRQN